jgi:hypothetical protein
MGIAHFAMHVRNEGDASGPRAIWRCGERLSSAGPAWAREACWCERGLGVMVRAKNRVQHGRPDMSLGPNVQALVVPFNPPEPCNLNVTVAHVI